METNVNHNRGKLNKALWSYLFDELNEIHKIVRDGIEKEKNKKEQLAIVEIKNKK